MTNNTGQFLMKCSRPWKHIPFITECSPNPHKVPTHAAVSSGICHDISKFILY